MSGGITEWVPVISVLAGGTMTGGFAMAGIALTHHFTRKREREAAARKTASELYFIATELVFRLEDFVEACAAATHDNGCPDEKGFYRPSTSVPSLEFGDVTGDWRALPASVMYRLREFSVLQAEASGAIANTHDYDFPPDFLLYFRERQYQYARLGLRALFLAKRLRKLTGMPSSRLDKYLWSPQKSLWQRWRKERKSRHKQRLAERSDT